MSFALSRHIKLTPLSLEWSRLIITLLSILIWVLITSQIYVYYHFDLFEVSIYNSFEAAGALILGFLSDKYIRRKVLLCSHLIALVIFVFIVFWQKNFILFCALGLFFNPLPILRASLIDNLTHFSKIKVIALSFAVQNIPWATYHLFFKIPSDVAFNYAFYLLIFSTILNLFLFADKRDAQPIKAFAATKVHPEEKSRLRYTLLAAIPTQLVYFFSVNFLRTLSDDPLLYSVLSFGSVIGACIASLYKKTPHVSVLTITYGISMMLAFVPFSIIFIYHLQSIGLHLFFISFGCLGGFIIPFVYDIVLHAVFAKYRGTACGFLDSIFSLSSLCSNGLTGYLDANTFITLLTIPCLFASSTYLQKKSE